VLARVFAKEGVRWVKGRASAARPSAFGDGASARGHALTVQPSALGQPVAPLLAAPPVEVCGDVLLVAVGRAARVAGLGLDVAGVALTAGGKVVARHAFWPARFGWGSHKPSSVAAARSLANSFFTYNFQLFFSFCALPSPSSSSFVGFSGHLGERQASHLQQARLRRRRLHRRAAVHSRRGLPGRTKSRSSCRSQGFRLRHKESGRFELTLHCARAVLLLQGAIAARNLLLPLSDPGVLPSPPPGCVFTAPEVASVGLTEVRGKRGVGTWTRFSRARKARTMPPPSPIFKKNKKTPLLLDVFASNVSTLPPDL
jgi:hypothetical protein